MEHWLLQGMIMKQNLVIFDMDGTLFQTNEANYQAYTKAMVLCEISIPVNKDFFYQHCNGRSYRDFLPLLVPDITEAQIQQIHDKKTEIYPQYIQYVSLNHNLFSLIRSIHDTHYIALVTTATWENTSGILDHFHVMNEFDLVVTQKDVSHYKPDPEGFLKAMEYFHVKPEHTVIFEDSDVGIEAAKASGADYVRVAFGEV